MSQTDSLAPQTQRPSDQNRDPGYHLVGTRVTVVRQIATARRQVQMSLDLIQDLVSACDGRPSEAGLSGHGRERRAFTA